MHQTKVQNINFILESSKLYMGVGQMNNKVITHNVDPACMCKNWGLLGKYRAVRILPLDSSGLLVLSVLNNVETEWSGEASRAVPINTREKRGHAE
jgi:hypothetical protein